MKATLTVFLLASSLLATNFAYAKKPSLPLKLEENISSEKMELAKELVKLYDIKGQWLERANQSFAKGFEKSRSDNDPKVKTAINKIDDYLAQEAIKIEQEIATLYAETYTLQELQALNRFYATPEGKTILKKNQQISDNTKNTYLQHLRGMMYKFRD